MGQDLPQKKDFSIHDIPDWEAILDTLAEKEYNGLTLSEAFSNSEISTSTFYRRREEYPDAMRALEEKARASAAERLQRELALSNADQLRRTIELRSSAAELLAESLPHLWRIIEKDTYDVEVRLANGKTREKTTIVYPRDKLAAIDTLHKIAAHGVIPEKLQEALLLQIEGEEDKVAPILRSAPPVNFNAVALPPGAKVTINSEATVEGDWEEVEG